MPRKKEERNSYTEFLLQVVFSTPGLCNEVNVPMCKEVWFDANSIEQLLDSMCSLSEDGKILSAVTAKRLGVEQLAWLVGNLTALIDSFDLFFRWTSAKHVRERLPPCEPFTNVITLLCRVESCYRPAGILAQLVRKQRVPFRSLGGEALGLFFTATFLLSRRLFV